MNLILDDVVQILATGLIPLLRISALLLAAPLVSLRVVSIRIRVALAVVLTIFIYPTLDLPVIDPVSAAGLMLIVRELLVGLLFAVVLQVVNAALVVAGQTLSMSMGLGMAQTVDPNIGRVPVLASFLVVLSTLIFLSIGGHLILIELILMSFQVMPIGGPNQLCRDHCQLYRMDSDGLSRWRADSATHHVDHDAGQRLHRDRDPGGTCAQYFCRRIPGNGDSRHGPACGVSGEYRPPY